MIEIPEDIWDAAYCAWEEGNSTPGSIARAILAERKRCAAVARGEAHADCGVAEQIATFIEAGA